MLQYKKIFTIALILGGICAGNISKAEAVLLTDPNDARNWQGATVGTFAALYFGSNTAANRQQVIDKQLLDDGIFDPTGFTAASLLPTPWTGFGGGCIGTSSDTTGTGSLGYGCTFDSIFSHANTIDNTWFQSSGTVGETVFDLGFDATKAAIFNTIDHGPLPQEAIESTVFLSDGQGGPWTQAVVERVWLEGFNPNLGIQWDGFVYAVGTGTDDTFRYASVIHGGPGALINDGDDEINGIMGLNKDLTGNPENPVVPEPASMLLLGSGLVGAFVRRRRS